MTNHERAMKNAEHLGNRIKRRARIRYAKILFTGEKTAIHSTEPELLRKLANELFCAAYKSFVDGYKCAVADLTLARLEGRDLAESINDQPDDESLRTWAGLREEEGDPEADLPCGD